MAHSTKPAGAVTQAIADIRMVLDIEEVVANESVGLTDGMLDESHFKRFLRDSTCQLPRCWVVVQDD